MAPPEYPKIVVTPSSANTCTIISAPVIFWPASGWRMEGAAAAGADKSRIFGVLAMAGPRLSVCRESLNGSCANGYSGRAYEQLGPAKSPTTDASYHRHPSPERGRRVDSRDGPLQYPRLQHRVAVRSGHG